MKCVLVLMGVLALVASGGAARAEEPGAVPVDGAALRQELRAARERLALLVDAASKSESRLMLEKTQSAVPPGYPVRSPAWGDLPFAQVCPVSSLVTATLGERGAGTVMGALTLLESGQESSGPGVYLLFRPGKASTNRKSGADVLQLLRVTVDATGRVRYAIHAEAKRVDKPFSTEGEMPIAGADFDGLDLDIRMRWDAETFHFRLRPAIIFV